MILAWHRCNQTSKRLNCIPGVGPLLATALVASVGDPKSFRSGRNFSAWIGAQAALALHLDPDSQVMIPARFLRRKSDETLH
jgi:Transposase IS116/IS110/IS902 family